MIVDELRAANAPWRGVIAGTDRGGGALLVRREWRFGMPGGGVLWFGLALCALPLCSVAVEETEKPPSGQITKAIRIQDAARRHLQGLIETMRKASLELEKTDPDTAKTLAIAAEKAHSAFVADDMRKVIQLLHAGLVIPADVKQAVIIRRLRAVLEALRRGGGNLDAQILLMEQLKNLMDDLKAVIEKQRGIERTSSHLVNGKAQLAAIQKLRERIRVLVGQQQSICETLVKVKVDPVLVKAVQAALVVKELLRRVDELGKFFENHCFIDEVTIDIHISNPTAVLAFLIFVSLNLYKLIENLLPQPITRNKSCFSLLATNLRCVYTGQANFLTS